MMTMKWFLIIQYYISKVEPIQKNLIACYSYEKSWTIKHIKKTWLRNALEIKRLVHIGKIQNTNADVYPCLKYWNYNLETDQHQNNDNGWLKTHKYYIISLVTYNNTWINKQYNTMYILII